MVSRSKTEQAETFIRGLISQGKPGQKLPREAALATAAGVSRVTIRDALDRLWTQGAVVRRWGAGTFISSHAPGPGDENVYREIYLGINGVPSLPAEVRDSGRDVLLADFAVTQTRVPSWIHQEMPDIDTAWLVRRCFIIDGTPAVLVRDYIPLHIHGAPTTPTELSNPGADLPSFLRSHGAPITKQESTLDAVLLDDESAQLLGRSPVTPTLRGRQRAISDSGTVISCAEIFYNADAFHTVLVRAISS